MKEVRAIELTPPEQHQLAVKILETDKSHKEKAYALKYVMNNNLFSIVNSTDTEITLWIPHSKSSRTGITLDRIW